MTAISCQSNGELLYTEYCCFYSDGDAAAAPAAPADAMVIRLN